MGELHKGIWEDIGTNERFEDAKSKYERKGGRHLTSEIKGCLISIQQITRNLKKEGLL